MPDYCIALNYKSVCLDFVEPYGNFKDISGEYKQGLSSYSKDFFLNKLILDTMKYIDIELQVFYCEVPFDLPELNAFVFVARTKQESFTATSDNVTITSEVNDKVKLILPKGTFEGPTKLFFQVSTISIVFRYNFNQRFFPNAFYLIS